jgi:hypothetical protein
LIDGRRHRQYARLGAAFGTRAARPPPASVGHIGVRPPKRCTPRIQDAKQHSPPRSRSASLRPGGVLVIASTPIEGRAERRQAQLFSLSRMRGATDPRPAGHGASHDAGRSPLGAPPWRFSAGPRASISGIASGSVQRAPRSQVLMPDGRGSRTSRARDYEPQPQDATPRSAFRIVSRGDYPGLDSSGHS